MLAVAEVVPRSPAGLPRVMPAWGAALWVAAVTALWWLALDTAMGEVFARRTSDLPASALTFGVAAGVAGKLLGNAAEALFYTSWWSLWGVRIRLGVLWLWLLSLSLLDTFGVVAVAFGADFEGTARAAIGGVANGRLLLPQSIAETHPLAWALAGVSLLGLIRVLLTAWVLSRAARRSLTGCLVLTFGVWLATRGLLVVMGSLLRGPAASLGGAP